MGVLTYAGQVEFPEIDGETTSVTSISPTRIIAIYTPSNIGESYWVSVIDADPVRIVALHEIPYVPAHPDASTPPKLNCHGLRNGRALLYTTARTCVADFNTGFRTSDWTHTGGDDTDVDTVEIGDAEGSPTILAQPVAVTTPTGVRILAAASGAGEARFSLDGQPLVGWRPIVRYGESTGYPSFQIGIYRGNAVWSDGAIWWPVQRRHWTDGESTGALQITDDSATFIPGIPEIYLGSMSQAVPRTSGVRAATTRTWGASELTDITWTAEGAAVSSISAPGSLSTFTPARTDPGITDEVFGVAQDASYNLLLFGVGSAPSIFPGPSAENPSQPSPPFGTTILHTLSDGWVVTSTLYGAKHAFHKYVPAAGFWPLRQRQALSPTGSWPLRQRQNGGNTGSWPLRQRQKGV